VHGYDGSAELPSAVADSLMDVALEIVTAKISAETGNQNTWKYEGSRFAHAWIHNQHQGILAFHEKATQIWISDGWLDLDTDDYVAYIYAKWKITDLDATAAGGLFEGHPEWIVDVDVEEQMEGASSATEHSHTLRFDGSESSNWVTLTGLRADACTDLDHVDVAFEVEEDDPGPNTHLGSSGRRLRLNCVTITQQAAQQFYGGRVPGGMLPGVTGSLLGCEEEGSLFTIDPSTFCLDNNDVLRGSVPGGFDTLGETLVFFAEMDWKAEAWLVAR
ncbi:MAG: hypothetical protein ACREA0_09650, partial [bacterium]